MTLLEPGTPVEIAAKVIMGARPEWPAADTLARSFRELLAATQNLVHLLAELSSGETCDHASGICWCSHFDGINSGLAAIAKAAGTDSPEAHGIDPDYEAALADRP